MASHIGHEANIKKWIAEAVEEYMIKKERRDSVTAITMEQLKLEMQNKMAKDIFDGVSAGYEPPEEMEKQYGWNKGV